MKGTRKRLNGLSKRVIANQRYHFAEFGTLWRVYADGQLGHKLGDTLDGNAYSSHAVEEMWKHALSGYQAPLNKEKFVLDSKEEADDVHLAICKSMEELIKNGTVTIPAKYNNASAGQITIDRDPSTKNYFVSSETGLAISSDGNSDAQQREAWMKIRGELSYCV